MSSPIVDSSVILVMNIQVVSVCCHRVNVIEASFKIGRVSPDNICRMSFVGGSLSGSPDVMSDLAVVMDVPVSVITRYAFSPIHSSACRLSWPSLTSMLIV
jgi:hypothetical protein